MLQAWALPIENSIGVGGFDFALAANPLTSGVGREGSPGCSASSVPPERFRLSLIEDISEIKIEEKRFRRQLRFDGDDRERRCFERNSHVEEIEGVVSGSSRCRIELRLDVRGCRGSESFRCQHWHAIECAFICELRVGESGEFRQNRHIVWLCS